MKTLYKYILVSTLLLNMLACKHQQTVTKSKDPSSTKPEKSSNSIKKQYATKFDPNVLKSLIAFKVVIQKNPF